MSILMILQIFVFKTPANAAAKADNAVQKSEGQKLGKRAEIFEFKNTEKEKSSWFKMGTLSIPGAETVDLKRREKVKIETAAKGLSNGTFNWEAFGQNKKFTAWIEVAYKGEVDETGEPIRHKVSGDFEINSEDAIEDTIEVDASKTVEHYYIATEYDKEPDSFKINAFFKDPTFTSDKGEKSITFKLSVNQIVSTKITYNLIDEYGTEINLNDAKEEKPADTDLQNLGKIGSVTTFNLKKDGTEILWQKEDLDAWDLTDSSLTLSLTRAQVTSGGIDYKLTSTYDVIKGGTVTIKRQKDAVSPKDPRNPGTKPEGYARINLSADAQAGGPTGTFTKDDSKDTQRVVDVRAGKPYTSAKTEIEKQGKPFPLTNQNKVDAGKVFKEWTPELSTLGTAAADETKTLHATYQASKVEIIPYLPTEPVPKYDKDGLPIPTDYVTVTFKSESDTKGKVKIGDKEGAEVKAKVKPGIDLSQKTEITTVPAEKYGFTQWKPALTKAADGQTYTAYFVKSGEEIGKDDPIPNGWHKVTVSQDKDSIQAGTVPTKYYPVQPGDKLAADKFPSLTDKANRGYKDPAWYVGSDKVDNPHEREINSATDFVARATELESHKITKDNGLNPVDITAYKGDVMGKDFWKKGVALQTPNDNLQKLLDKATVTDATTPTRTTSEAGVKTGTLTVTFSDGSTIDVPNQTLTVIDTKVDIDYDKDPNAKDDANAPRHKDEVVKGKIESKETLEGAKVEILDSKNNVIGITLADKNGSFIAGTRPLQAGETIKVRVTLPKAGKASDPVEKQVQLNPDELNNILPTADKLLGNLKGKPGLSKARLEKLEEAIIAGEALVDAGTKKPAASVKVDADGQKSLDTAYENIKKAMEDLIENKIPMINGQDHKEIFVGGEINLDDVTVADDNIKKQKDGKDYTYTIYDASGAEVEKTAMVAKDGVYRVVYSAEDAQGVKASHTMTVLVKKTVVEVPGKFPDPTPDGYVKVEFKSGDHAGLNGVSKFLVQKGAQKSVVTEPTIIPKEGYKVAEPKWSVAIPDTFDNDFATVAQVLAKVTTTEPGEKDKAKYATLTFEAGDHGEFEQNAKTTIWVLKNEKVKFNAPGIKANEGFTFAGWEPKLKEYYDADQTHTAQYASNSDVSDVYVKDFQEVKFLSGTDGNFGMTEAKENEPSKPITEKSVWVRPGKLVDLRTKAPKVTVTTTGKSHIGWDKDLVGTFTKADQPTVINAKYDDTVKTTKPTENTEKYAKVDFVAGNLGKIENNQTTTFWVVKGQKVTDTFKAPTVTANTGWKVKTGNDAWSPAVATKYTQDTIHVAQYDYDGASVVPQKPGETKPNVPSNFVKVEFKKGEHGIISSEETTVYWVDPKKPVTAEFKAPNVIADTNYKHIGWNPALTANQTFAQETDIVAQYKSTVVKKDPQDANYVTVEFNAKDHGTLEGTAKFWVYKNEKVSITAPKVTAKDGFVFYGWDPEVKGSYAEATVHNAKYESKSNISDTKVKGFQEVKFLPGTYGKFEGEKQEKSVWVRPNVEVDLTRKAPKVIANAGKAHTGWSQELVGTFTKSETATEITAQYSDEQTPEPDVTARNIGTAGPDGKKVPAEKTTVEIKTVPKAKVTIEYTDKDGQSKKIENLKAGEDGKLTQEITPKLDKDTPVKVTVQDGEKQPTDKTVKVFDDLDDNKIPDTQAGQTERPAAIASNVGSKPTFTTIKGKTEKGATITVTVKVNGKEKPVTVENLKVNDDGTYTLEAKYENKPLENGAEILVYAENAPKKTSKPQTTTVFNDSNEDGKPDGGKVDLEDVKDIQVIAPDKMSYTQGDKLDPTGLKVVVRDNNEGIEIFDYDNETGKFKDVDGNVKDEITATVAGDAIAKVKVEGQNKTVEKLKLEKDKHDGKAIDVQVGQVKGSTNQKLEVKQLQTPTPTIEFAANQNTVGSTGQATETAKQKTTVKFKVVNKPTTVYVRYTVNGEAKEESFDIGAGDELTKTVDLKVKLPVGTEVQVLAKDPDKTLSKADKKNVVRDANNDGTADDKTPVGKAEIDGIKAESKEIKVKPADNATELVIKETDKSGNTPNGSTTITVIKDADGNWKIGDTPVTKDEATGKLTIPTEGKLKLDEYNVVEVESKGDPDTTTPSNARETVGEAADTTAPDKPVVDQPVDGDSDIKVKTPTEKDAKTITVEVEKPGAPGEPNKTEKVVVEKDSDGKWKIGDTPVKEENGKLVIPVDPALKKGDKVTVEVKDDSGNPSKSEPQTVIERQKLDPPTINPIKIGEKTVSGTALTNKDQPNEFAASTVDIYKKVGNNYEVIQKGVGVNSDGTYNYLGSTTFKDGDVIRVVANKPGMTSSSAEITVGVDTAALDKAIQDGKDALDPQKGGINDGTPEDKALEKAIQDAENLKKRTDPKPPTQKELNEAKDKIEKAIEAKKKTDKERQKLKDIIEEAEKETQKDGYKEKPGKDRRELENAIKEGKDNLKNNTKIPESTTKIEEALEKIRKESIVVGVGSLVEGLNTIEIRTSVILARVVIKIDGVIVSKRKIKLDGVEKEVDYIVTDSFGTYSLGLESPLMTDQTVELKASKPGYNDGEYENDVN